MNQTDFISKGGIDLPVSPLDIGLSYEGWRPHQAETILDILASEKRIVVLVAPMGSGKSLVASAIPAAESSTSVVLTKHKSLQDQYQRDFPEYLSLKGMSNYNCILPEWFGIPVDQAPCQSSYKCELRKDTCPYYSLTSAAVSARNVVTNYDYALHSLAYTQARFIATKKWLIADEAQFLDAQLTNLAAVKVEGRQFQYLNPRVQGSTRLEDWLRWANEKRKVLQPKVVRSKAELARMVEAMHDAQYEKKHRSQSVSPRQFAQAQQDFNFLHRMYAKLDYLANVVDESWIIYNEENSVSFRPLWVSEEPLTKQFFNTPKKVILMSGTLPPKEDVANLYGLDEDDIDVFQVPSVVPLAHRMVYCVPIARMSHAVEDQEVLKTMKFINTMLDGNRDKKVLIHTNSNSLQRRAASLISSAHQRRVLTHTPDTREGIIRQFQLSKEPFILISPSVESGLDVPDLELQFILKVLWPSLADPWVDARRKDNPSWYLQTAVDNVVQAIGRVPRNMTTVARTFIFDSNFRRLATQERHRFPDYILESLKWITKK